MLGAEGGGRHELPDYVRLLRVSLAWGGVRSVERERRLFHRRPKTRRRHCRPGVDRPAGGDFADAAVARHPARDSGPVERKHGMRSGEMHGSGGQTQGGNASRRQRTPGIGFDEVRIGRALLGPSAQEPQGYDRRPASLAGLP